MIGNSLWFLAVAGGPVLLGAVIMYVLLRRRHLTPEERETQASATRDLFENDHR